MEPAAEMLFCSGHGPYLGLFIPDSPAIGHRLFYALCARHYPPTPAMKAELERKFYSDPALCSFIPEAGNA
jgi:hypothetical protein